jgi:hypothetical protein
MTRSSHLPPLASVSTPAHTLELEHLTTWAAWLAHAPCTARALAGKSDRPLVELAPRTVELHALGALVIVGETGDGPVYALAHALEINAPSGTDLVERRLNTLPIRDQVSIAAGIMSRHGRRSRPSPAAQLPLAESAESSPSAPPPPLTLADAGRLL